MIEVTGVGGYSEVGRNMTAVKIKDDAVIFDMGFYMQKIADFEEQGYSRHFMNAEQMIKQDAIPNDNLIKDWWPNVRAIALSHAHLDHVAGSMYLSSKYNASIYGTPYTLEVLRHMLKDDNMKIKNPMQTVRPNNMIEVNDDIKLEFIGASHSVPQTAMVALHTKKGVILYTNDFKFDNHPIIGEKPNYKRLKELAKENVIALVLDALYARKPTKTPSESVAREMLREILLETDNKDKAIVGTCFASNIARLKSFVDFGRKLGRKIVFLGRSLRRYVHAAEELGIVNFSEFVDIAGFRGQVRKKLSRIKREGFGKYLIIATGGQAEKSSVLRAMLEGELPFEFGSEDHFIFSNITIPVEPNITNRKFVEDMLHKKGMRVFKDVHVSVLPDTYVVTNDNKSMKIKQIRDVISDEKIKVAAFDPIDFKIKWFDGKLIKHNYSGKIFDITTKSGRKVSITSGHSVFKLSAGKVVEVSGDDLKLNDHLAIPKEFSWWRELDEIDVVDYIDIHRNSNYANDNNWIYYAKKRILPRKLKLDINFARLLGYYLAEGSAPRHISLTFGKHESDLIEETIKLIKSIFNTSTVRLNKGGCEIHFGSNIIKSMFKKWFGDNARNKRIPDFVFSSSNEFKLNFLGAYINGDGHIESNDMGLRIRVKTASERLASDLLYLFSQLGMCAKFDHKQIDKPRYIAGHNKITDGTVAYVIRIQGKKTMEKVIPYLSQKFKEKFSKFIYRRPISFAPEALPLLELNIDEISSKPNTTLRMFINDLTKNNKSLKYKQKHMNPDIIKKCSYKIKGVTKKIIDGDLLFDPVKSIEIRDYDGWVYDFEVPNAQNFIGGFGGIILHNSGHGHLEDMRDLINLVKPKHIIPSHGHRELVENVNELGKELGYNPSKEIHILKNGQRIKID